MTKRPIVTYKVFDVVAVPFPFTDSTQKKRRPALVLSSDPEFNDEIGHSVMAMITSAENASWPLDTPVTDLPKAGLPSDSVVRMKLFTLDRRFVIKALGSLGPEDRKMVMKSVSRLLKDSL